MRVPDLNVHWTEEHYEEDLSLIPKLLKNRSCLHFYRKCALNKLTIYQGDIVCILNSDVTSQSYETCWVVQIIFLYEDLGNIAKPAQKAYVKWFSRVDDNLRRVVVNQDLFDTLNSKHEVIEDFRESPEIDIESIFDVGVMLKSKNECRNTKNPEARFFCNYKLKPSELKRKLCIVPINEEAAKPKIGRLLLRKTSTDRRAEEWKVMTSNDDKMLQSIENLTPKSRKNKAAQEDSDDSPTAPKRRSPKIINQIILEEDTFDADTPSTPKSKSAVPKRRKSILKTPTTANLKPSTPRRSIQFSGFVEQCHYNPKESRFAEYNTASPLLDARKMLHVSAFPSSLPCREKEFQEIYSFLSTNLEDEIGGCIYISGVPGTGKTATTNEVIKALKKEANLGNLPDFDCVEINGMKVTEPRKVYQEICKQLTGKTLPWEQAYNALDKRFTTVNKRRISTILIVDELDVLCNKRQDVVYNILNWPNLNGARLIVVTIANTMDLPERILMGKVSSRMGLTRLTFQPYTHKQLQEIVASRLDGSGSFNSDAIQLVARKVAALSGDARRALDICRRASEIAEHDKIGDKVFVNMSHVTKALEEMISSTKVKAVKACSLMERLFIQSVCMEIERTGCEEVVFQYVYNQLKAVTSLNGLPLPNTRVCFAITTKLNASRLLVCEHNRKDIHMKIILNISSDDFYYATRKENCGDV